MFAVIKSGKKEVSEQNVTLNVDGVNVPGIYFAYTYSDSFSTAPSEGDSEAGVSVDPVTPVESTTTYELVFKYSGFIYQVSGYSSNSRDLSTLSYKSLTNAELETIYSTMLSYENELILY